MKTTKEIQERIDFLSKNIKKILDTNEKINHDKQTVIVESQVEETFLNTLIGKNEEELMQLLEELEEKSIILNNTLNKIENSDSKNKHKSQAKVWTNNIKINAVKWILEEK